MTEIVFLGFSDFHKIQVLLFVLVLAFYVMALLGNTLIIIVTVTQPILHAPMYFFLRNLSFLDIGFTSAIAPKLLVNLLSEIQTISFTGCGVQMFFFLLFGLTECCLLFVMAYDRYVAIYRPLQYTLKMNQKVCTQMAAFSWTIGLLVAFGQTISMFTLPYCGSNRMSHFFCDISPLLRLASTDTYRNEVSVATVTIVFILVPFLLILLSYIFIISTVLRMPSVESQRKAFSTCSSHLIVVSVFYGTAIFTYVRPKTMYSPDGDRLLSLMYTIVTPSVNPIVYSLRNKEVRVSLRKSIGRKTFFQGL
ncbi:olfactory receptor 10A4-like [Alligator mississippiensis]|uniref:olfactory receptor 10A4-like n=1 Tax=Alligator mississippiensis TaxID=8496 RepID=UPI002877CEFE|nr:olfactory receptor 10A4-like [Alligator mississippiensis]